MALSNMTVPDMAVSNMTMTDVTVSHWSRVARATLNICSSICDTHPRATNSAKVLDAGTLKVCKGKFAIFVTVVNAEIVVDVFLVGDEVSINGVVGV